VYKKLQDFRKIETDIGERIFQDFCIFFLLQFMLRNRLMACWLDCSDHYKEPFYSFLRTKCFKSANITTTFLFFSSKQNVLIQDIFRKWQNSASIFHALLLLTI